MHVGGPQSTKSEMSSTPDTVANDLSVTVTVYFRDSVSGPYEILDGPRQSKIGADSMNLDIGWWFPGSDSSLDKVVIDGIEYTNSDTGPLPMGKDTVVRDGSEIAAYKTSISSEEEEFEDGEEDDQEKLNDEDNK